MTANTAAATDTARLMKPLHAVQTLFYWLFAAVLLGALASPTVWARTVLDLDAQNQPVLLKDWGDYWVDPGGQLSAQQISEATTLRWQPTQRQAIYPLSTGQALWIRFSVPPAPDTERWYVELPDPSINRISLFTLDRKSVV